MLGLDELLQIRFLGTTANAIVNSIYIYVLSY